MQANAWIVEEKPDGLLLTAFYGVLDTRSGRLAYANAGHLWPLQIQAVTGQVQGIASQGILLGAFEAIDLEEYEVTIAPGDCLVLYSDGVTEAMDADHRLFGEKRLRAVLAASAGATAQQVLESVVDAVRRFTGDIPQSDDMTITVIRRAPDP
jgi:sigma-B regulation protein RsbU (phosphoserine phosphatase)